MCPTSGDDPASADPSGKGGQGPCQSVSLNDSTITMKSCQWATMSDKPVLLLQDENNVLYILPSSHSINQVTHPIVSPPVQSEFPEKKSNIVWLNSTPVIGSSGNDHQSILVSNESNQLKWNEIPANELTNSPIKVGKLTRPMSDITNITPTKDVATASESQFDDLNEITDNLVVGSVSLM